jgi:fructose-specific phosphotransferase system IIC component
MISTIIIAIVTSLLTIIGTTTLMVFVLNKMVQRLSEKLQSKLKILTNMNLKEFVDTDLD